MCINLVITVEADDVSVPTGRALTERIPEYEWVGTILKTSPWFDREVKI